MKFKLTDLINDALHIFRKKIPELQTFFAYESAQEIKTAFACHTEDNNLHSLNHFHIVQKI